MFHDGEASFVRGKDSSVLECYQVPGTSPGDVTSNISAIVRFTFFSQPLSGMVYGSTVYHL